MLRRRIPALFTAIAVVASGLTIAAVPAHAAVTLTLDTYSPTSWAAGSTNETTITWSDTYVKNAHAPTQTLSVEIEWDWTVGAGFTAGSENATFLGSTFRCPSTGITFSGLGKTGSSTNAGEPPQCVYRSANAGNPVRVVELKDGSLNTNYFTYAGSSPITVTIPQGLVTSSTTPRSNYRWTLTSFIGSNSTPNPNYAFLSFSVPATGGIGVSVPVITININENGGTCTATAVTGFEGSWAKAPDSSACSKAGAQFIGFNTKADGSGLAIAPGGNLNLTGDNTLFAIYESPRTAGAPTDVVATAGLNSVKVTWKAPSDPGSYIVTNYLVQATPSGKVCITRPSDADMLSCTFDLPATNTKYAFKVQALNGAGWGPLSTPSAAVSPYGFRDITASRPNILLGLGGTRVEASGSAPGLAGKAVNAQFKVGSAKDWTTQANAANVNAQGTFNWSRKFGASLNKQNVTVRFTYGADLVSGTYVLSRGAQAGSLTAPRNIKVENVVNKVKVSWDPPKFDGGEKITGYTLCAVPSRGGTTCRSETGTSGIFGNLSTLQTYTITVAAKTAQRGGPAGKSAKTVDPTEASISAVARSSDELTVNVRGEGFKKNSRFRVEVATPIPGTSPDSWAWDEVRSFGENQVSFRNTLSIPLDASLRGERLVVRLVTPTGPVYSRSIRP